MKELYDFYDAAKHLNMSYGKVTRKCREAGFELVTGREGRKYLNKEQLNKLKEKILIDEQQSTGYRLDVIRITETFYIYPSKMNH